MDKDGAVRLEHEQSSRFRKMGCEPTRVGDLAAGNDKAHACGG